MKEKEDIALEEFVSRKMLLLANFKAYWLKETASDIYDTFPDELREADWDEQFEIFCGYKL